MEIKEIKNGRYGVVSGILKFDTNKGLIEIPAKEALEIAYTLYDYCDVDIMFGTLNDVDERLLKDAEVNRRKIGVEKDGGRT